MFSLIEVYGIRSQQNSRTRSFFRRFRLFFESSYELQPTCHSTKPYNWGLINVGRLKHPTSGDGVQHPADDIHDVYRMIWAVRRSGNAAKELQDLFCSLKMLKDFSEEYEFAFSMTLV